VSAPVDYERLRNEITGEIERYRATAADEGASSSALGQLIERLLDEREIVLEEIDDLKEEIRLRSYYDFERNSMRLKVGEIDEETYNSLSSTASRLNTQVGSLLNEMMRGAVKKWGASEGAFPELSAGDIAHLSRRNGPTIDVSHSRSLTITGDDLENTGARVRFSHIDDLEFDSSVDEGLFQEKVRSVDHCRSVTFPEGLSKLLVYAKCSHCASFEFAAPQIAP